MRNYVLIYEDCCFYEIVILCYFLKYARQEIVFCSKDGNSVTCMEGFAVVANMSFLDVNVKDIATFTIPGGIIDNIRSERLIHVIQELKEQDILIAAICAGVDLLEEAGILKGVLSTHSEEVDCINDHNIITARANAYVDFAIEFAKKLNLFEDEKDMLETIDFWKYHKRA